MKIEEIRQQYPQYSTLSDGELAYRIWDKNYKGTLPMGVFADQVGLSGEGFGGMIGMAKESGYEPTTITFAPGRIPENSKLRSMVQGVTFGFGDEMAGLSYAAGRKIAGSPESLSSLSKEGRTFERGSIDQYRKESPAGAIGTEIAGSMLSPTNAITGPAALAEAAPMVRGAITGATSGAAYGAGTGEGGLKERAVNAVKVAIPSALFGAATQGVLQLAGAGMRRVARAFDNSTARPTIETLRQAKNIAYDAASQSGATFDRTQMQDLFIAADDIAKNLDFVPEADVQTAAALKVLERYADKDVTLGQLDKLRQRLWERYNASGGSEPAIRGMIDHIDGMVANVPATSELMSAARLANSRFKKAELLEEAFTKAERQTAATGSGGNVLNKYRQAVTSILSNPKEAKWFNDAEIASMDNFVRGSVGENVLRRIGKLSPSGNGLMLALNIAGAAIDPSMLGVTAAGAAGKALSDSSTMRGAESLLNQVATGRTPYVQPYTPNLSGPAAVGANRIVKEREK